MKTSFTFSVFLNNLSKNKIAIFVVMTFVLLLGAGMEVKGQNAALSPGNIVASNTTIYDRGGLGSNYTNNTNEWITIAGRPGATITISGTYALESGCNCDYIYIRDGYGNTGTVLQTKTNGSGTISYTGTSGQTLTVQLTSDGSDRAAGFTLNVTYSIAQTAPTYISVSGTTQTVACGTPVVLKDHAGDNTSYSNGRNDYIVLNAVSGSTSTINITGLYQTETNYDYIRIYSGSGTGGALLATYHGTGTINYTGSAGQTLTVQFTSDVSTVAAGFALFASYTGTCTACTAPTITGTTPASRCGTGTVSLGATASAGTINWYSASTGGSSLGTGTSYSPSISATTNYYVDATDAGCTTPTRTAVTATVNNVPAQPSVITGSTTPDIGSSQTYSVTNIAGVTYNWTFPTGWAQTGGGNTYSITVTVGTTNGNITCTPSNACGNGTASTLATAIPPYKATFTNMNTGSSTWCAGEVRNVTVTVTNTGTAYWTDSGPDINIGCKWNAEGACPGSNWCDYDIRCDANNLAPGASATYTLAMTAPLTTGSNNLTFDLVNEGNFWFANQGNGSVVYTSPAITIATVPTTASTPSPANAATGVCYAGGSAVTSVSWASSGATSYDVYFGAGSLPGTVTSNVGTNSYNCGTLTTNTTYYWKVVAKNSCGDATGSSTWSFTTGSTPCYCESYGGFYAEGIMRVVFNTIDNNSNSNPAGYSNYTGISTSVSPNSTYQLSVYVHTGGSYTHYQMVWIDWDQDGVFNTTTEQYNLGTAYNVTSGNSSACPYSITVPSGAAVGNTRMRVSSKYSSVATACQTSYDGEVEDYTINVIAPCAVSISSVTDGTGCGSGTVLLSATGSSGTTAINWYEASSGGTSIGSSASGATWTSPSISSTTTYYAAATNGSCESVRVPVLATVNPAPTNVSAGSDVTICNGSSVQLSGSASSPTANSIIGTATATDLLYPFNTLWEDARSQYILLASELSDLGITAGYINSISFNVNSASSLAMNNFNIHLKNTSSEVLTDWESGLTNVFSGTYTVPSTGWQAITFQSPFYWDGSSNLLIQICFDNSTFTTYSYVDYRTTSTNRMLYSASDDASGCSLSSFYVSSNMPIFKFDYTPAINYSWSPTTTLNNSMISNPTATPTLSTTYTVSASIGSCSISDDVTVTVRPEFTAGEITEPGVTVCFGENPDIIANEVAASGGDNSITYEWRAGGVAIPGANAATYDPASGIISTTTFTRWAHDNTCNTSWAQSTGSYTVTVQTPPQPTGLASGDYFWTGAISDSWNSNENWLYYNGTSYSIASSIPDASSNVFIQSYSGTCATTNAVTNASSVVYANDVNIGSGLTLGGLSNLQVNGDWNNSGTFIASTGTVAFVGNSVQTINPGASSFNNIVLANTAATNSDIVIAGNITINGNLALTSGILNANGHTVNFGSAASVTENSSSSFVHGKMIRNGDTPFKFPTGDVINRDMDGDEIAETHVVYTPFEVNPESMATVEVEYFYDNTGMPDWWEHGGNMDATLHHVSDREHWIVNSDQSLLNTKIYWVDNGHADGAFCIHGFDDGIPSEFVASDLAVTYWSSTLWRNAVGTVSGNHDNGSITSSYIPFGYKASTVITFGSKHNLNPLPVELIAYKAECKGESTELYWATASEVNNDYFVLQRSTDAQNFNEIARIIGHGNSNVINYYSYKDTKQESGTVYYRLVQYDYDGASEILGVVQSNCNDNVESVASVEVSPNPFRDYVNIYLNNFNTDSKVVYEIVDQYGRVLVSEEIVDTDHKTIYLHNLKLGLYMLRVFDGEKVYINKIIKN